MRAFVAISVPKNIAIAYSDICRRARAYSIISVVRPEKMHITLAFFDDLRECDIPKVREALLSLDESSFEINCTGYGLFRRREIPSIVFVKTESNALNKLAKNFREKLAHMAIPFDSKPFKSHLTLGRVKEIKDSALFEKIIADHTRHFEPSSFYAKSVSLFSSDLITYKEIFRVDCDILPPP